MKNIIYTIFLFVSVLFLSACGASSDGTSSNVTTDTVATVVQKVTTEATNLDVPTLVVVMNWSNIADETDAQLWHNKIFDLSSNGLNSVDRWYRDNTNFNINLVPVNETSGTVNDGVIIVNMGVNHPGGNNDTVFRDTYITDAITSSSVINNINFAQYDKDANGFLSTKELQIIFIVAGGEAAYSGNTTDSIWAHSWFYESNTAPIINGVKLMNYSTTATQLGSYSVFGSIHGGIVDSAHKATIGIITHELGHSLYNLVDLYDNGNGSGIGLYGLMSDGAWGQIGAFEEAGESPTQFSSFSKLDIATNITTFDVTAESLTLKCSGNEQVKLKTSKVNEYFLLECRDTARSESDKSFSYLGENFTNNLLFATLYHIDEDKVDNTENGTQTLSNHYKVALIERNIVPLMTSSSGISADFSDVYVPGYVIDASKIKNYEGLSEYNVYVLSSDYDNRTMTFKITK